MDNNNYRISHNIAVKNDDELRVAKEIFKRNLGIEFIKQIELEKMYSVCLREVPLCEEFYGNDVGCQYFLDVKPVKNEYYTYRHLDNTLPPYMGEKPLMQKLKDCYKYLIEKNKVVCTKQTTSE